MGEDAGLSVALEMAATALPLPEYTDVPLEEELEQFDEPLWMKEEFEGYDDYEAWYVKLSKDLLAESKARWGDLKRIWTNVERRLEREASTPKLNNTMRSDIPIVEQMLEEAVAVQCENLPRPSASQRQPKQEPLIGALNYCAEKEFEANNIDLKYAKMVVDLKRFNLGVLKQVPNNDPDAINRINISKVDPRHCWFDPFATDFHLKDCKYFICAEPMDLSEIRDRWPEHGGEVGPDKNYTLENGDDELPADRPRATRGDHTEGSRHRALVIELWLNDNTKDFKPQLDENGAPKIDSRGNEIGTWVKRYPKGRLIITANNILLFDAPNPFDHGDLPYTFFPNRMTGELLHVGDADSLFVVEDKLNRLARKTLRSIIVQMNNPWVVERHAFDSPEKFKMLTNDEDLVVPITAGAKIMRLPPGIVPPDAFTFMEKLAGYMDDILGLQPVLRGQLQKGAQLAADAVEQLQVSAQARLRLKSRMFESALKDFGFKFFSNIRQFTPGNLEVQVVDPTTQQPITVRWSDVKTMQLYDIDVTVGSSLPGSKEMGKSWILRLWDKGLLSKSYTLRNLEVPGAEQEIEYQKQQMQAAKDAGIQAAMTGQTNSKAGRKEQEPII